MKTGKVKFFNDEKGYGFIIEDGTNNEVFVHVSKCRNELKEGDRVTFDIEQGKRGPNAVNVELE